MSYFFNTDRYLSRINYPGEPTVTLECLRSLHRHHIMAVPFEATDIHFGHHIHLDPEHLFDKVIVRRRGGFCYELNFLFNSLLREIGFTSTIISASVNNDGVFGPLFDHMCIVVELDGLWLVDVGFGDLFLVPIRIESDVLQEDRDHDFMLKTEDSKDFMLLASRPGLDSFEPKYRFDLTPRRREDFVEQCRWKQASSDSHFVKNFICTLATEDGRKTIRNGVYKVREKGTVTEQKVVSKEILNSVLRESFGLG